jgi:hypothetical protein
MTVTFEPDPEWIEACNEPEDAPLDEIAPRPPREIPLGWCLTGHHHDPTDPDRPGRCPGSITHKGRARSCSCGCHT